MDIKQEMAVLRKREKFDLLVEKAGGVYKLSALLQKRIRELVRERAKPLVDVKSTNPLDIVIAEMEAGMISLETQSESPETTASAVRRSTSFAESDD